MAERGLQAYDLTDLNLLVLEKHVLIRQLLTDVFKEFGVASTQSTSDPEKAFNMFAAFPPDIVITDWTYDLNGLAFIQRIRKDPDSPNPFVPVIMATANTRVEHICIARDVGMTEYLTKPISAKILYRRIVAIIEDGRCYVRNSSFFGPDRRRRKSEEFMGVDRRIVSVR